MTSDGLKLQVCHLLQIYIVAIYYKASYVWDYPTHNTQLAEFHAILDGFYQYHNHLVKWPRIRSHYTQNVTKYS